MDARTPLILSDDLALEAQDGTHVTVFHRGSAARWKMSRAAYRFLLAFEAPRTVGEVAADEPSARLWSHVRALVAKGVLLDAEAPRGAHLARLRTAVAYRFCNAPAFAHAAPRPGCVVLGVPYDLGDDIDSRSAPAAIRQKSLDHAYEIHFSTGRPRGWFDANRDRRILEGVTIADAGDVHVEYGEDQRDLFARIGRALEEVCACGTVPVLLGGDRSITWAAVDHMRRLCPLTVVQFAKRPAIAACAVDGFVPAESALRRLSPLEGVGAVFAVAGLEGDPHGEESAAGAVLWSAAFLREAGPSALARRLTLLCQNTAGPGHYWAEPSGRPHSRPGNPLASAPRISSSPTVDTVGPGHYWAEPSGRPHSRPGNPLASAPRISSSPTVDTVGPSAGRGIYLSIDMSATTRDYVRPRSSSAAAGLTLAEIAETVRAIGAAHRIRAIDIVGLNTRRREAAVSSVVACHLALGAMSAACDGPRSAP